MFDTKERKVEICHRAYKILTEQVGFDPQDIIFDPNIFPVATGMDEHRKNAVDFRFQISFPFHFKTL